MCGGGAFVAVIQGFSSVREPPCVAQVGLKLTVLPEPSRCWDLVMLSSFANL